MEFFSDIRYPITLLVGSLIYWRFARTPEHRSLLVVLLSQLIYFTLSPVFCLFSTAFIFAVWGAGKSMTASVSGRIRIFRASLLSIIAVLIFFKYGLPFFGSFFREGSFDKKFILPLGISYFCFRCIQYLFDCYRGTIKDTTLLKLWQFLFFIPLVPAGPLETYQGFYEKKVDHFDSAQYCWGLKRIIIGYIKKLLLLELIFRGIWYDSLSETLLLANFSVAPLPSIAFVFGLFIYSYLDLSAYSDIAIGYSALFGFRIVENFRAPLLKTNLSDFWRSWHISLSSWCRNNVYFPIFGFTRKPWLGMYASMMVMGLWHYVSWNWALWGLYHGTGLAVVTRWSKIKRRSVLLQRYSKLKIVRIACWLGTLFFVSLGYALVGTPDLESGISLLSSIFRPAWQIMVRNRSWVLIFFGFSALIIFLTKSSTRIDRMRLKPNSSEKLSQVDPS